MKQIEFEECVLLLCLLFLTLFPSAFAAVAFTVACLVYSFSRFIKHTERDQDKAVKARLAEIEERVNSLAMKGSFR